MRPRRQILLESSVSGERLYAYAKPFNWTDVLVTLRKLRPDVNLPANPENEGRDLTDVRAESKKSEDIIKSFFGVDGFVDTWSHPLLMDNFNRLLLVLFVYCA